MKFLNLCLGLSLMWLVGCSAGKNLSGVGFEVRVQGVTTTHPIMVFAQDTVSKKRVSKSFGVGSEIQLSLPSGTWTFTFIGWDGANVFEGLAYCYTTSQVLSGTDVLITADLNQANCNSTVYGAADQYDATNGILEMTLHTCNQLGHITDDTALCENVKRGFHRSYKIQMVEQDEVKGIGAISALESDCIDASAASDTPTTLRLPAGEEGGPFSYVILGYETNDCTGTANATALNGGLVGGSSKAYPSAGGSNQVYFDSHGALEFYAIRQESGSACDFSSAKTKPFGLGLNSKGGPYIVSSSYDGGGSYYRLDVSTDLSPLSGADLFPSAWLPGILMRPSSVVKIGGAAYISVLQNNQYTNYLFRTDGTNHSDLTPTMIGDGAFSDETGIMSKLIQRNTELHFGFKNNQGVRQQLCSVSTLTSVTDCTTRDNPDFDKMTPIWASSAGVMYYGIHSTDSNKLKIMFYDEVGTVHNQLVDLGVGATITSAEIIEHNSNTYLYLKGSPDSKFYLIFNNALTELVASVDTNYNEPMVMYDKIVVVNSQAVPIIINYPTVDNLETFTGFVINSDAITSPVTRLLGASTTARKLYFSCNRGRASNELDVYFFNFDTSSVTPVTTNVGMGITTIYAAMLNNKLYFNGTTGSDSILMEATDSSASTVATIHPSSTGGITDLKKLGDKIYFQGDDGTDGVEPWVTDGTGAGTFELFDVSPGAGGSYPTFSGKVGDYAIFKGYGRYYRTKGTIETTAEVYSATSGEAFGFSNIDDNKAIGWANDNSQGVKFTLYFGNKL